MTIELTDKLQPNLLKMNLQYFADDGEGDPEPDKGTDDSEKADGAEDDPKDAEDKEPEAKYTDDDVDKIIDEKFKRWKTDQEKQIESRAKELAEEKVSEAEKLKKMSDDEKKEYQLEQAQKRIQELEEKESVRAIEKQVVSDLKEKGVEPNDDILGLLVSRNAEETKKRFEQFVGVVEEIKTNAREEAAKRLGGRTPLGGNKETEPSIGAKLAKKSGENKKEKSVANSYWGNN